MDQQEKNNSPTNEKADKKSIEIKDEKLIELTNRIFDEITDKHKLNERKLRKLLAKYGAICQSSSFQDMFKNEIIKEQTVLMEDYEKLEAYQIIFTELDNEIATTFKNIKLMEFNIDESRSVESFRELSENIESIKHFLGGSKSRIDQIYKRIQSLSKQTVN